MRMRIMNNNVELGMIIHERTIVGNKTDKINNNKNKSPIEISCYELLWFIFKVNDFLIETKMKAIIPKAIAYKTRSSIPIRRKNVLIPSSIAIPRMTK